LRGDADAIAEYCDLVLSRSSYPTSFPQEFQTDYQDSTKTLVVDYQLPAPDDMPTLHEMRYISSCNEFKEVHLKDKEVKAMYNDVVYQISLRTIHEFFESDQIDAIDAVVFNGWIHYTDPRSGHHTRACIASVQATRDEFLGINLRAVDPKECFRALKGIAAANLASIAPVAPILQLNKQDSRFVASREITSTFDQGTNIAAIGWEEFEHLVREIFSAEFSAGGGEVKVTQSSRDWGVDAVAFDPDPIRGGKIVIQAKRYTNPVDVAAVRDLYGTVMNEGATKGILVTTSSFGPDAYRFAKDKPLTLLDGSNLLHLLSKHGHRVRIDLKEAKKLGIGLKR
jgi:restriction system protein